MHSNTLQFAKTIKWLRALRSEWRIKTFNLFRRFEFRWVQWEQFFAMWVFGLTGRVPLPKWIAIDATNICNLACPLCPTGAGELREKKGMLSRELFEKILSQLPSLRHLSLHNWGEPLLNPELFSMIRLASAKGIRVSIHSNLSLPRNPAFFEALLQSDLKVLIVSLDGASQETYEKYRVGGNFALVIKNLKTLVAQKEKLGLRYPFIVWKMIVHKQNEHEVEIAREMAREIGVCFEVATIHMGDYSPDIEWKKSVEARWEEWKTKNPLLHKTRYSLTGKVRSQSKRCSNLFHEPVINPNGLLYPCCHAADEKSAFADLGKMSFKEVWNGPNFLSARNLFVRSLFKHPSRPTVCDGCNLFTKRV